MASQDKSNTSKSVMSKFSKAGLQFPFGCVARYLKTDKYDERIGSGPLVLLTSIFEYVVAEEIY